MSGDITLANKNVGAKKVWLWKESYGDYFTRDEALKSAPEWYHVPEIWERVRVYNVLVRLWIIQYNDGEWLSEVLKLPLAGYRYYDSSTTVYHQGNSSDYWSSSPNGSYARNLYLDASDVYAYRSNDRAFGFSLRCFRGL
jgi:hypothetical protein